MPSGKIIVRTLSLLILLFPPSGHAQNGEQHVFRDTILRSAPKGQKTASFSRDSTLADSLRRDTLFDSLRTRQAAVMENYLVFPASADSLFPAGIIGADRVFNADAAELTELLRISPWTITVPYTLSSPFNRVLYYGLPASGSDMIMGPVTLTPGPLYGADVVFPSQIIEAAFDPCAGGLALRRMPGLSPSPHTYLSWENALFRENILSVKFIRPLARTLDIAVFSNYRRFDRTDYNHDNGDIFSFYNAMVEDTSLLSHQGRQPFEIDYQIGAALDWRPRNGGAVHVTYRYFDLIHDLVDYRASRDALSWKTLSLYNNLASGSFDTIPLFGRGPLLVSAGAYIDQTAYRTQYVSQPLRSGSVTRWGGSASPFLLVLGDTLGLHLLYDRDTRSPPSQASWEGERVRLLLSGGQSFTAGSPAARIGGRGGFDWYKVNKWQGAHWTYDAAASGAWAGQTVRVVSSRGTIPYAFPEDSMTAVDGPALDAYVSHGVELDIGVPRARLFAGYRYIAGIDPSSLFHAWPEGMAPYDQPHHVAVITPSLGRLWGMALQSKWLFADTRPTVKSETSLSWETPVLGEKAHFNLDLRLVYWSRRDSAVELDNRTDWNRDITDLSLKLALQISSFRFYYKIDNLLNRRIAYVPGYWMPGLTFRWGFTWIIPG